MEVRIVKKHFQFASCWIAYVDNKPMAVFNSFQEAVKQLTECRANCKDKDEADAIGIGHHLVTFIQKNTSVTNWET